MVKCENVSKWFGHFQVLKDISLEVVPGEVLVILGPSGSGKSTLLRSINALEPIQKGKIWVDEESIHDIKQNQQHLVRRKIGMVFQQFNLFQNKTALENITISPINVLKLTRAEADARGLRRDHPHVGWRIRATIRGIHPTAGRNVSWEYAERCRPRLRRIRAVVASRFQRT